MSLPSVLPLPLGTSGCSPQLLGETELAETVDWFSFHRLWGLLAEETLMAIARSLQLLSVVPHTEIYQEGQTPIGLYVLKWGSVEIYRQSVVGKTHILYRTAGDLFGYIPFMTPADDSYQTSAITLSPSEVWFLSREDFDRLIHAYPDIQETLNRLLAQDITQFTQRIAWEQTRIQELQPFLRSVPAPAPLIGTSKAARKLARQAEAAAADLKPVVLQAPPGTGKTFLASWIHGRSGLKQRPFAELDCLQLPRDETGRVNASALFGHEDGPSGVLELLERGTLLIDNVQVLSPADRDRLVHYLQTGTLVRNAENPPSAPAESWVRLILASPNPLPLADMSVHTVKLFNLAQRKEDIPALAQAFLERFCQERGRSPLQFNQADLRRLVSYDYPGNLSELAGILQRAVIMTPPGQAVIPESVLWSVQTAKNAFRIDLLNQLPWLRHLLLSSWWPQRIWLLVMAIFIPVTVLGFIGPQQRDASITLNFFWAWWWPLYLFLFAFVGRLWCAVCPFMITGEWVRQVSLWIWPRSLRPWPTKWMHHWGAWILFAGFLAIYLWEKLWDLPHTAYLSAWLLLVITAGAVLFSLIYERRLWCRYLCPIGGMNGLFAKLSMLELRSMQQVCGSQCSTFGCYKGSPATPVLFADALSTEGQATDGCPLYSHPAQLADNRDCVLCMTCLKACPHRSVQLNLRFPATDLLENHQGFWAEAALLLLLFGGVLMHHSDQILTWLGWPQVPIDADHLSYSLPIALLLLGLPALLTVLTHGIARWLVPDLPPYLTIVYAYLPLTLAANLADYVPAGIMEAGQVLPVLARTLGYSGAGWPTLTWGQEVARFLQGVTLLSALVFSPYPLVRITQRSLWQTLPHLILLIAMALFFGLLMI